MALIKTGFCNGIALTSRIRQEIWSLTTIRRGFYDAEEEEEERFAYFEGFSDTINDEKPAPHGEQSR